MQDRYAGDIGDFGKFALLKELERQELTVGVNWYKTEPLDSEKNSDGSFKRDDGKHIDIPENMRACDTKLADNLAIVAHGKNGERCLKALQIAGLLRSDIYYDETLPFNGRDQWHQNALAFFSENKADLVFLDPDNGLLVNSVGKESSRSVKYVFYEEVLDYLEQGKSVLIYNHRSRKQELQYFKDIEMRLQEEIKKRKLAYQPEVLEITFPRYSVRDYIAISARPEHTEKIRAAFETMWTGKWVESRMCQKPLTMDITYSEFRARFSEKSKTKFLKYYQALPEEVMIEMVDRMKANTTCKACAAGLWHQNRL